MKKLENFTSNWIFFHDIYKKMKNIKLKFRKEKMSKIEKLNNDENFFKDFRNEMNSYSSKLLNFKTLESFLLFYDDKFYENDLQAEEKVWSRSVKFLQYKFENKANQIIAEI